MEGQRILSCRNGREASKMYVWTEVILFFMLLVLTLPALGAVIQWPGLRDGTINKELAYGMLLAHYLPPGILGVAVSAILASIMGTVSSNMNFGAQVFVNDVYKRSLVKEATSRHYLLVGRIVATVIVGLAIVVATVAQNVIDISVFMLGLSSAELTANWAQWWWWRFNGKARLAASFGGPLIFLFNKFVIFPYVFGFDAKTEVMYQVVLTSMAETCLLWIVVALITPPEPQDKLVEFYRRARPMGWWGPIAAAAGLEAPKSGLIGRGFITAALGAMMVGAATIAATLLFVGKYQAFIVATGAAIAAGVIFKIRYNVYLNDLGEASDVTTAHTE
jgi:Na+/proline symporter